MSRPAPLPTPGLVVTIPRRPAEPSEHDWWASSVTSSRNARVPVCVARVAVFEGSSPAPAFHLVRCSLGHAVRRPEHRPKRVRLRRPPA
jgi:hypothetical protein